MLAGLGIRLVLWLGKEVPLPAPPELLAALTRVEITNDSGAGDGFQLTFQCKKTALGDFAELDAPALEPLSRVILGVVLGASPEALLDGVITHVQLDPGSANAAATLTVTGKDLSALMDLEEKNVSFENQTDSLIVLRVLAGYARYGIVPAPYPTTDVPISIERVPRQQETDLVFLRRLAQRNGFVFYLEPLTFGVTRAYFGPRVRAGLPQRALSADAASGNTRSLTFSGDALASAQARGVFVEPITRTSIPIPSLPSLRLPPLSSQPARARRTTLQRQSANQNPGTAAVAMLAAATNTPDALTAQGEVDTVRYGAVLRARSLVGVRGAGRKHDGLWTVRRVTHELGGSQYSQKFTLGRDGLGSTTPVVVP